MENLEKKYNRYAAVMRRHLETVRRACAYWSHGSVGAGRPRQKRAPPCQRHRKHRKQQPNTIF